MKSQHRLHPANEFSPFPESVREGSIGARFEQIARQFPQRLAVCSNDDQITYEQLDLQSNSIARALWRQDDSLNGDPIAMYFNRGIAVVSGMIGVLKAGKAFVLLDPDNPPARIQNILQDSQALVVLTDECLRQQVENIIPPGARILTVAGLSSNPDDFVLSPHITPDTLASLTYTSGSTGQPKGVPHTHRQILHDISVRAQLLHIDHHDRLTLFAHATGQALYNILLAILCGSTLYSYDLKRTCLSGIFEWLKGHEITVMMMSVSIYRRLVSQLTTCLALPHLRLVRLASETVIARDVAMFQQFFPSSCQLCNTYSNNENGMICCYFIDPDSVIKGGSVPIGFPLPEKQVALVDETGAPAGPGEVGEIIVQSLSTAHGYWRRPDLTATDFKLVDHTRQIYCHHTGDLGRLNADGAMVYVGRKNFRVKIRGYTVDLAEVEAHILSFPGIEHAVVSSISEEEAEPILLAYVVAEQNKALTISAIHRHLRQYIPDYMLPHKYLLIPEIPLLANGKVDRLALSARVGEELPFERNLILPRNPCESALQAIWEKLLSIHPIGVTDNFFARGGDSYLILDLYAQIEACWRTRLPVSALYENPTIAQFAGLLQEQSHSWSSIIPIRIQGNKPPLIFLHGISGDALYCHRFVPYLAPDQPVYGIQSPGCSEMNHPLASIEEMAAYYIHELNQVLPEVPFVLVGWSWGARVAYEMARQLFAQGRKMVTVIIIDAATERRYLLSSIPYFIHHIPGFLTNLPRWLRDDLLDTDKNLTIRFPQRVRRTLKDFYKWVKLLMHRRGTKKFCHELEDVLNPDKYSPNIQALMAINFQALRQYKLLPYAGQVTLFRARTRPFFHSHDWDLGWNKLALGGIEVISINGYHYSIVREPRVRELAMKLQMVLDRNQSSPVTNESDGIER